jgi:hypothetical protein
VETLMLSYSLVKEITPQSCVLSYGALETWNKKADCAYQ